MRTSVLLAASAALALSAGAAAAQASRTADPRVEPAFENTIISTYRDGRTGKLWLNRDGTYRGQGRTGRVSIGTWAVDRDRICMRQRRPFFSPIRYCTAIVPGGVGTRWTGRAPDGEPINIQLVAGRQG